jgi:hypothetical protein
LAIRDKFIFIHVFPADWKNLNENKWRSWRRAVLGTPLELS